MSIAGVSTTSYAAAATQAGAAATPGASAFGAQLQSAIANQASAGAAATAYQTEPGRGTPAAGQHHHHSHGSMNDLSGSTATAQSAGSLLYGDMQRGLQAYGATKPAG